MDKEGRLVRDLLLIGVYLGRQGDRIAATIGLNQQQFVVLKIVEERGPLMQKDICSELLLEKANVSKMVGKLERQGLVRVSAAPADGRATMIEATAKGRRAVENVIGRFNVWNKAWLGEMGQRELEAALEVVGRLSGLARKEVL